MNVSYSGSITTDAHSLKGPRKSSIVYPEHPSPGLDVDLAKAIKVFFRDMRNVQHQLKEMRDTGKFDRISPSLITVNKIK